MLALYFGTSISGEEIIDIEGEEYMEVSEKTYLTSGKNSEINSIPIQVIVTSQQIYLCRKN